MLRPDMPLPTMRMLRAIGMVNSCRFVRWMGGRLLRLRRQVCFVMVKLMFGLLRHIGSLWEV